MALYLVIHRPDEAAGSAADTASRAALRDAVWEVADSHWAPTEEATLVSTDLSADYLLAHFRSGMARRGYKEPGLVMVVPMRDGAAFAGLPEDGAAWIAGAM
ncbi:hypothetical protein [Falsiroseomonas oryzae]|uniref:hypothetical protein n=1 Tax=Falsiroseomonas oryzae TaxID=2766473 RepID=UPI0022EB1168|nr:hypothetical protein [Roseomonas sp. MO-31]